jgi:hypothetical protein
MRTVRYKRHEYHWPYPQRRNASLIVLVYDIPYFGACGIFPPLHVCNWYFSSGGGDGGMSPGASWEPFEISADEYAELVEAVRTLDPGTIADQARYTSGKFAFDDAFDGIADPLEWYKAVCDKHREAYHRQLSGPRSD